MKKLITLIVAYIPLVSFGQFNLLDKLEFYADVAPYQLKSDGEKNKIAFSVTANYNVIKYLGLGVGLNSNAGYIVPISSKSNNVRQTSAYLDIRPKLNIGKNQILCFGNVGLPLIGYKSGITTSVFGEDPNQKYKADLYYAAGIGYARKIFGRLGLQVNYKWANIHVDRFTTVTTLKGEGQHILSIGVVF